jgi:hypothetical protein
VGWVLSVSYNPGLKRYVLMTDHTVVDRGNLGIFDAPAPWGPWTTALWLNESEGKQFGAGHIEPNTYFWNMPQNGWAPALAISPWCSPAPAAAGTTTASTWSGAGLYGGRDLSRAVVRAAIRP